jgi:D-2-hydroxyacid dehydrogenase (NADP+)
MVWDMTHMRLIYLPNSLSCFQPTDGQVRRFEALCADGVPAHLCRTEEEFLAMLPEASAVFVWRFRQEWFGRAPKLRHLCTPAAGRDYFRVSPPPEVTVHYGTFHGAIMAEAALGAVLACSHGLLPFANAMRQDGYGIVWPRQEMVPHARRLSGQTVVVLGFGHIGRAFGALVKPLGAVVVGVRRSPAPDPAAADRVVGADELDAVLPSADHLVCFLPSGPETTNLLDARRIALLKPSAFLYNFGRGNLVDEAALAAALRQNALGGAVLDVFQEEPLPADSPLRAAPNCFLYPHASAFSPDYLDLCFEEAAAMVRGRAATPAEAVPEPGE